MEHHVMKHSLVTAGAAGCPSPSRREVVAGKVARASPRLRSCPRRRFADEGRRPAPSPGMPRCHARPGAVSMNARASPVRACTRSSRGASSAKCSTRSPASPVCGVLGQVRAQLVRAVVIRHVGEGGRLGGARSDGGAVCVSSPATSGHGAWSRRRAVARHGSTTTVVSMVSISGPAGVWLAPNSLRTRRPGERTTGPCPERPPADATRQGLALAARRRSGAAPARRRDSRMRQGRIVRCGVLHLSRTTGVDDRNSGTTGSGVRLPTMRRGSAPLGD